MLRFRSFLASLFFVTAPVLAEPGFYFPEDSSIPAGIAQQKASVFRLILLKDEIWTVTADQYESLARQIREGHGSSFLTDFVVSHIEGCQMRAEAQCDLPPVKGHGTAFLAVDNQSLWSVRHNFHGELANVWGPMANSEAIERYLSGLRAPLKFLLTDDQGNVVYDTREKGSGAHLEFYGEPALRGDKPENYRPYDVVRVHLDRPILAPVLKFQTETAPRFAEKIYILGYPAMSQNRQSRYGVPDSDGQSFRVSYGQIVSLSLDSEDLPPLDGIVDLPFLQKALVFFTADAIWGNSGSPILNERGEVVSIFAAHQSLGEAKGHPELEYSPQGGQGISIPWMLELDRTQKSVLPGESRS